MFMKINLILFSFLFLSCNANALLSTHTINVINGNEPQIINKTSAENNLKFIVNGVSYSESIGNIQSNKIAEFDGDLTFNDFNIPVYTSNDLDKINNYGDRDGDNPDPTNPFVLGETKYSWYDNNNVQISSEEYNNIIGCGSGYKMPLKLVISLIAKANSQYGIPKQGKDETLEKTYQIAPQSKICYAKPYALVTNPGGQWRGMSANGVLQSWNVPDFKNAHPNYGGGYTNDYVPNWGFKASPSVSNEKFPTTGFPGAQFQLIMPGSQTDYSYALSQNPGNNISIDNKGNVFLHDKPTGPIVVSVTLLRDSSIKHNYQFDPRTIWVEPQKAFSGTWEQAVEKCGGIENMLSRSELTNSPQNHAPGPWEFHDNIFTRAIGQGVVAEWGSILHTGTYPSASWEGSNHFWTKDVERVGYSHFLVVAYDGNVSIGADSKATSIYDDTIENRAICKK